MATVVVSACLMGQRVRYDGKVLRPRPSISVLRTRADILPVCPECMAGLQVPREPMELFRTPGAARLLGLHTGRDYTELIESAIADIMALLRKRSVSFFLLKSRSPSCGKGTARIHGNGFAARGSDGLFVRCIEKSFPGVPIADESRMDALFRGCGML